MRRALSFGVLLLVSFSLACSHKAESEATQNPPRATANKDELVIAPAEQAAAHIETQAAIVADAPETLHAAGRIALADNHTYRVGVRSEGLVVAVYVGLGDYVQKGKLLARYHADEVREARAQYRTAVANQKRLESAAAQAQRDYDRAQTLLNLKAGSVKQVEQERDDLVAAQAALKSGQIAIDRLRDQLEDDLKVPADPPPGTPDEIADDVPIFAPAAGYVIEKNVTPGKTVQVSSDTFVIGDLSQVWMLASIRQENLGGLRVGQTATVSLTGLAGQTFQGKITNLGQQFDPATRVMQVRILLNNPGNRLRPEMLATADIPIGQRKPVLQVGSDAVQQVAGQDVVFLRTAPDRFSVRAVRAGETVNGRTVILEGLKAGEQVVTRGSFVLKSQLLRSSMESE